MRLSNAQQTRKKPAIHTGGPILEKSYDEFTIVKSSELRRKFVVTSS